MSVLARLWALRRERPVFVAVSSAVLGFFLLYPAIDWWLRSIGIAGPFRFFDFGAYAGAVDRWLDGAAIYRRNENGGYHQGYLYPPVTLLLFWPFTELPHTRVLWNAFSVGVLWLGIQAVVATLDVRLALPERGLLLWALLGFQPLLLSIKLAQTAGFLAGLLCLSLAALLRDGRATRLASGACTAVVGVVKLTYATAGAHLLSDRDRFLGALATGLALLALSVAVFGIDAHLTYLDVLAWGFERGSSARSPGLWLAPYYRPLYWLPASNVFRVFAALVVAVGAFLSPPEARREVFALGVAAIPLLAPLTYAYYFVALLPAFLALLAIEFDRDGYPLLPVVALLVVSVHSYGLKFVVDHLPELLSIGSALRPVYPLLQPGLWGNVLFVGLAAYRVGERVRVPEWLERVGNRESAGPR